MISRDPDGALIVDGLKILDALESDSADSPEMLHTIEELASIEPGEAFTILGAMAANIVEHIEDPETRQGYMTRLFCLSSEVSVARAHAEAVKLVQEARLARALNPTSTKH